MSKKPKEIKLGYKYLGRGEYSRVIRLLEPKIPLFLENKEFYAILAKAFFYTGDYAGSKLYFDRGQKIHWDIHSALYLGAIGLKRRDYNSSIRIWLDILDEDPENKIATRGLATLKKYSTMDELETFIHSKKIDKLIPRKPIRLSRGSIVSLSIVGFLVICAFSIYKFDLVSRIMPLFSYNDSSYEESRAGEEEFSLKDLDRNFLDFENVSTYSFSGAQIEEFFSTAHELFLNNSDNRVRTYLNLIRYSNANSLVKEKAKRLESYLVDPNWANYRDEISIKEVRDNTLQYENCIVKWKGSISNLSVDNKIVFDLLVGYDDNKTLEGIVPVVLNQNIKVDDNRPIEVLGKIKLNSSGFYIEALTVMHYINRD